MIAISEIQLFNILKARLGEKEAQTLVEFVDFRLKEQNDQNLKVLATREVIEKLRTEIRESKLDTIKWLFGFFVVMMLSIIGLYFKM